MKLFVVFFLLLSSCAFGQEVNFFKEDITFRLSSEYFYVYGTYWFSNQSDHNAMTLIYYPFPVIGQNNSVDSMDIFDITDGARPNISNKTENGFSFMLTITAHDTTLYHIAYRQKVSGDSASYILRSTQAWNRPLEYAEYKFMSDSSIGITWFSYQPDRIYNIEGKNIYLW